MAGGGSYSGDPATSRLDAVRSLLGDTGGEDGRTWILLDAEITYFDGLVSVSYDDPFMSAAVCADIISGRYAQEVSISADGVSISMDNLQQKYRDLAASLRQSYQAITGAGGYPLVGGIDAFTVADPTVKPTEFAIGMDDNFRAGWQVRPNVDGYWDDYYSWMESSPW